jgi:methanogenic corrinoid protein MtbC1
VVPLTEKQLSDLCITLAAERAKKITPVQRAFIDDIQKGQQEAFHQRLVSLAQAQGVLHVVPEIIAPLTTLVGHQWEEGSMSIYDEHLYTMCVMGYLRSIQPAMPAPDAPRVLLASASGEQHSLGLLMVECLLRQFGARCINLGTQVPTAEIVKAASAHEVDAVALSYSSAFKRIALRDSIHEIRQALPKRIPLWVGGNATQHFPVGRGIQRLGLNELEQALQTVH